MKLCLFILCFLLPASLSAEAQGTKTRAIGRCDTSDKTYGQENENTLVKYLQEWVEKYNSSKDKILQARSDGFLDMGTELRGNLCRAFPRHRFILPDIWIWHRAWFKGSYLLLQDRNGNILSLQGEINPGPGRGHGFGYFAGFLRAYPAKNREDALFKVRTLMEILTVARNDRIDQIRQDGQDIVIRICSNESSIRDLGGEVRVRLMKNFSFGNLYFEDNRWERDVCKP